MSQIDLSKRLSKLPTGATESTIKTIFLPFFLEALGFNEFERYSEYKTGKGANSVDFAARRNIDNDIFLKSQSNPNLIVEVKGQKTQGGVSINLAEGTPRYLAARAQLQDYLLSPNCHTAQWGIITNALYIQLFRKHGKVIVPATKNISISLNNINQVVSDIKYLINDPPRALTVCAYNFKGGIGKTTTVVNLAGALAKLDKKVLVLDFDTRQQDLTNLLNVKDKSPSLLDCILDRNEKISNTIQTYTSNHRNGKYAKFDIIPSDSIMSRKTDIELAHLIQGGISRLKDVLSSLKSEYDYILIDSSPNWDFFSQSSIYAADCVLIPTRANDVRSLENAATAIVEFIPEIKKLRQDGGPIGLPIFFNGPSTTKVQISAAKDRLKDIASIYEQKSKFKLMPYFFPKFSNTNANFEVFELRGNASVTKGAFLGILPTLLNKIAADHYQELAKEYFLT